MMAAAAAIAGHFTDIRNWKFQYSEADIDHRFAWRVINLRNDILENHATIPHT